MSSVVFWEFEGFSILRSLHPTTKTYTWWIFFGLLPVFLDSLNLWEIKRIMLCFMGKKFPNNFQELCNYLVKRDKLLKFCIVLEFS